MLSLLHIENIAVIEKTDVEFGQGLNVLTGETGAGKSIVIDAIDAVLGGRTSRELVRAGADRALVSAVFTGGGAEDWCAENGVDIEDGELVLQRRIGAEGKSGCRVNGAPVSVTQLRELGALLLDIHGQNDGRQLMNEERHREYLDRFGELGSALSEYRGVFEKYRETLKEIDRLSLDEFEKQRLTESLKLKIEELEDANLRPGEQEGLAARRELLRNSGKLTEAVDNAYEALYGGDAAAIALSDEAAGYLGRVSSSSEELEKAEKAVTEARYMLEDAAERLRDFRRTLDFSPEEYDKLEERLDVLNRLSRKYGGDEEHMLALLEDCRVRLDDIEYASDRLEKLSRELEIRKKETAAAAAELSAKRRKAGDLLEKRIVAELTELNMPSVRFEVELLPKAGGFGYDSYGGDEIRFLMSANAGEEPGRISRIASGGELSRIMLAMKSVFAGKDKVESLVFDEIDAGVSGIAAQRVGEKLCALSLHKQILCVTHLPQIAAMADTHFVIEKSERGGRTFTNVTELDREGRQMELARLHGGDNITETTRKSAEEQLTAAETYKTCVHR